MKKQLLLALAFFCCASVYSQDLMVHGGGNGLYLDHTVSAKEGLYSIGRNYNVNPKSIAAFNHIDMSKGLEIGQQIKIPLTDTNFSQKTANGIPVYYLPGAGEGLMKVSNSNKKVSLASLRTWNKLSGDNIRAGEKLVVGYLVSKDYKPSTQAVASTAVVSQPEVIKMETAAKETAAVSKPETVKTETAIVTKPESVKAGVPAKENAVVPESEIKTQTVRLPETSTKQTDAGAKTDNAANATDAGRQDNNPANPAPVSKPAASSTDNAEVKLSSEDGFFKTFFDQQVQVSPISRNTTVTSGIFKTSSGWQDSKYYLLMDNVATGTIVRIINPDNNKAVYAKVLGEMNGIRQNQGLGIRISNAAASALGIREEDKFIVRVNY